MKTRATFIMLWAFLLFTLNVFSQAPQGFNYQAVVRDNTGSLVSDQAVGIKISLLQGAVDGTVVYSETHSPTTNSFGLVTLEIGDGSIVSGDLSSIDWGSNIYFIKVELDATGGTTYTEMGTSQILSVPYALHAKSVENKDDADADPSNELQTISRTALTVTLSDGGTYQDSINTYTPGTGITITNNVISTTGGSIIPIYTSSEITALLPEEGQTVYNSTEDLYQVYIGSSWVSLPTNCWPQPTTAIAGSDSSFNDGTTTTNLSANTPETNHGTGTWSIISGEGGSFTNVNDPNTTFSGNNCTDYELSWTITTLCGSSTDEVIVSFNHTPTTADAGNDQYFNDGTTTTNLSAITPETNHGTGTWSIISGVGGSLTDINNPNTTLSGQLRMSYTLRWTIITDCDNSYDDVNISFYQDEPGSNITDVDNNTYNTVWIGTQLWMAENLNTTHFANSDEIPDGTGAGDISGETEPKYWFAYDDDLNNISTYGRLYTRYTVTDSRNVCPDGWHVPSFTEWITLENYLIANGYNYDGTTLQNKIAKSLASTTNWSSSALPGVVGNTDYPTYRNKTGFTAFPGGYRTYFGAFSKIGYIGYWWSLSPDTATNFRLLYDEYESSKGILIGPAYKANGYSVRCIKD